METLSIEYIKHQAADSPVIFSRGESIFFLGNYMLTEQPPISEGYRYRFDGSHGEYEVLVSSDPSGEITHSCTCPYPEAGCKHTVAALLDIAQRIRRSRRKMGPADLEHLTPDEIRQIAVDARHERGRKEEFMLLPGDTVNSTHVVRGRKKQPYEVTFYSTSEMKGHCTCPDFSGNHLELCKHMVFAWDSLMKKTKTKKGETPKEASVFPFVHITWSSRLQKPVCYYEQADDPDIASRLAQLFNEHGEYTHRSIEPLFQFYLDYDRNERLKFDPYLLTKLERIFHDQELSRIRKEYRPDFSFLKTQLYPYQTEGILFSLFRPSAVIADEMGLGKTLQAVAAALLKREIFGFTKALIVCPASLKNQWKLETEKFTDEQALVISGSRYDRKMQYLHDDTYLKITNYEALLRDVTTVTQWAPDLVILDEAQRIKNFETKTHQAINRIPRTHSLVLTGTPLENKLEDLYSIMQFCDPSLLTPLWAFAANHYAMSRERKNKILGYRNLDIVHEKVKPLLIRRTKKEVFDSLPEITEHVYFLDLSREQEQIHQGYMSSLLRLITKKIITPMDLKRIQRILLSMRMVCNSTYLIDKTTNYSPKLIELASILREVVIENGRKAVIFTEWTTMTYLIGNVLSDLGINFVEFTGKVPVGKRQLLIDEFRNNPDCMVFLSTDAGGVGLNLQNCDCLINIELPWNPAKLNQRIGRIHRIGQVSDKVNVIKLVTRNSIEEKVFASIGLKQELFDAVLAGTADEVMLSNEKKSQFLEQIRKMFGEEAQEDQGFREPQASPELDEQTPHFLNPQVLQDHEDEDEDDVDVGKEEIDEPDDQPESRSIAPEDLEAVLNQGMSFLNTLTQAATGKKLFGDDGKKSVEVDRETGEVVLRFKL